MSVCYVPGTEISILPHVIITTTSWGRYYYYFFYWGENFRYRKIMNLPKISQLVSSTTGSRTCSSFKTLLWRVSNVKGNCIFNKKNIQYNIQHNIFHMSILPSFNIYNYMPNLVSSIPLPISLKQTLCHFFHKCFSMYM